MPASLRLGAGTRRKRGRSRGASRARFVQPIAVLIAIATIVAVQAWGALPWLRDRYLPPHQFDISGTARVTDGDTLRIGDTRIRLSGIDAPERSAHCTVKASGARIACGAEARDRLTALVGNRSLGCIDDGSDRYGRTLATCYATRQGKRVDIAREMVRQGWALAYRRYSTRYVIDETAARVDGAGLWAMDFQNPEDYRREARAR
ncbi:MAG: thermonuclease family protein [Alphaproteobacteria bacterium]|nr:thermonuclease family protein [Alphaproteobacteria bacterium]